MRRPTDDELRREITTYLNNVPRGMTIFVTKAVIREAKRLNIAIPKWVVENKPIRWEP